LNYAGSFGTWNFRSWYEKNSFGTWNIRSFYGTGSFALAARELVIINLI